MAGSTIGNAPSGENTAPASTVKVPLSGSKYATLATLWQYAFNYITSLTAKTTLTGNDIIPLNDSEASNVGKGITWTNLMAQAAAFTQTLTNKNITPRNVAVTQSATPSWNCDNGDIFTIDSLAQAITSMTSGQSGTPVDRQEIDFEITDNGTARAITWGANFLGSSGTALPSTTVLGKTLYVKFRYNGSVWVCLASTSNL
jgi:hypothetical protein